MNLMRRIDEQFLEMPFYGPRQMRLYLQHQGIVVGRGRVRGHEIYPYLLRWCRLIGQFICSVPKLRMC